MSLKKYLVAKKSNSRIFLIQGVIIFLICMPLSGWGNPLIVPKSEKGPTFITGKEIQVSDERVKINVKNWILPDLLWRIQKESGIRIQFPDSLVNESITAHILAPDWITATRELLQDYGRIEIWNNNRQLVGVRLLGTGIKHEFQAEQADLLEKKPKSPKEKIRQKKKLNGSKKIRKKRPSLNVPLPPYLRREVRKVRRGDPLPPHLFHDLEFRYYLKENGIESLEDWRQIKKVGTIRKLE